MSLFQRSGYAIFISTCIYLFPDEQACDVTVSEGGLDKTLPDALTYDSAPTAEISLVDPNRGGTGGGNLISITGSGFG